MNIMGNDNRKHGDNCDVTTILLELNGESLKTRNPKIEMQTHYFANQLVTASNTGAGTVRTSAVIRYTKYGSPMNDSLSETPS